jgi:hypothetical protein
MNSLVKTCDICGKDIHQYHNYCSDWNCVIELNKRDGGIVYTPNNLPIRCIRADGAMLEHEHGDHPDYIFPVHAEYIGQLDDAYFENYKMVTGKEGSREDVRNSIRETHALLYANGSIAVTMYETCSAAWMLQEEKKFRDGVEVVVYVAGTCLGGHLLEPGKWKLTQESLDKINKYLKDKRDNVKKHS